MIRSTPRLAQGLATIMVMLAIACGGPPAPGATFSPDRMVREGCGQTDPPPLETALQVGLVHEALRAVDPPDSGEAPVVVLSVLRAASETEASDPWIRSLESTLDPEDTERLIQIVLESLPPLEQEDPSPPRPSFRLRLTGGSDPALEIGPSVECAPQVRNRPTIDRALAALASEIGGTYRAVVQIEVQPDGSAGEVELVEGSGSPLADRGLLAVARRFRFDPAHRDGFPIRVHSRLPLMFSDGG